MEQLTDSQKLDILSKRMKRAEISQNIQTVITIIGFLGIISLGALISKVKNKIQWQQ
jgi:hypothetical protein